MSPKLPRSTAWAISTGLSKNWTTDLYRVFCVLWPYYISPSNKKRKIKTSLTTQPLHSKSAVGCLCNASSSLSLLSCAIVWFFGMTPAICVLRLLSQTIIFLFMGSSGPSRDLYALTLLLLLVGREKVIAKQQHKSTIIRCFISDLVLVRWSDATVKLINDLHYLNSR